MAETEVKVKFNAETGTALVSMDAIDKKLDNIGKSSGKTAGVMGGLRASFALTANVVGTVVQALGKAVDVGKDIVASFAESQRVMAQTQAVIKSTGGAAGLSATQISAMSSQMQAMTTFSDEAAQSSANLLLTFTNVGGPVFKDATMAIADMSVAMGQDLKSSSIQVGKALNDPIAGITALQRVGVTFSKTQKEQIANFVKVGNVAAAQKIILGELNKEFGGSAAAAAQTFDGKMKQIANTLDDMKEVAGGILAEGVGILADKFKGFISSSAGIEKIEIAFKIITSAVVILGNVLGMVFNNLIALFKNAVQSVQLLVDAFALLKGGKIKEAGEKFKEIGKNIVEGWKDIGGNIVDTIRETSEDVAKIWDDQTVSVASSATAQAEAIEDGALRQQTALQKYKEFYTANASELQKTGSLFSSMLGDLASVMDTQNAKLFAVGKGFAIAKATIDVTLAAISAYTAWMDMKIIPMPARMILAVAGATAAGIAGAVMISKIAAQKYTPKAAMGGIIPGSAMGTQLIAGESGRSEAIVPFENGPAMEKLRSAIGGSNGATINIHVGTLYADDRVPYDLAKKIDRALYDLHRRGQSMIGATT